MIVPSIRRAAAADLPAIVALLAEDELGIAREDPSLPVRAEYVAAYAAIERDANQFLAVAEQDGEVIGCLQLSFIPGLSRIGGWRGQIESVRVAAGLRGRGIGRWMIGWAIAECRRRGCDLVQLTTDKARSGAIRFYVSLGFAPMHEGMKLFLEKQPAAPHR